jgi:hypothetical protein
MIRPLRTDGQCFRCHIQGIGFTFVGGGRYGRRNFHDATTREFIDHNIGEHRIRSGDVERVR